jgi:hypothetical protein
VRDFAWERKTRDLMTLWNASKEQQFLIVIFFQISLKFKNFKNFSFLKNYLKIIFTVIKFPTLGFSRIMYQAMKILQKIRTHVSTGVIKGNLKPLSLVTQRFKSSR